MSQTVNIYRETPQGDEIEINVESDGHSVIGAWLAGTDTEVELTADETTEACVDASVAAKEAAEEKADHDAAMAEDAWEARRDM